MIDFIKIEVPNYPREMLLNNSLFDFKSDYSHSTGEISEEKAVAEFNGMKFISLTTERLFIQGSIHKYHNFTRGITAPNQKTDEQIAKGFNGDIFNLTQLKESIEHLCGTIGIKPNNAILRGFEYGLNIFIENNPQAFLCALIQHKTTPFGSQKDLDIYYRQSKHQRYIVKCYDKQIQYGLDKPTIRFENKQTKMRDMRSLQIQTLDDLTAPDKLEGLKKLLLKKWDEVTLYDFTINKKKLSKRQKNQLKDLSNPREWAELKRHKNLRSRNRLKRYSENHGKNIHLTFRKQLQKQWDLQTKSVTN